MDIQSKNDPARQANLRPGHAAERRETVSPEAARQLVHELRVHQAELEAQNEELRVMQLDLATAHARYFDLYDLAPVGYCTVNDAGNILEVNLTAASMLGVTRHDMVGRGVQSFILPQDKDMYYLHRKHLVDTGEPQSCVLRLLRANGSAFWAQLSASLDTATTQNARHRLVMTDVDARKRAQDQIRISDVALKAVSQGVLITTPDLRVVSANQAVTTMFGYTAAELQGFHWERFKGPLTDAVAHMAFRQGIAAGREFSTELLHYRKDGSCFWNEIFVSPVRDEQGQLTHFISINTDITERKEHSQQLLEKNQALLAATEVAERANRAKSEFLSSMSHELRTPLNSILGFAQLLEMGKPQPTEQQRGRIEMIQRGGWYLLTLIEEILDLASIESGKVTLKLEPVSVAAVLAECQRMIEPEAQGSGIRVDSVAPGERAWVVADPVKLQQVLFNLLSNAIKYNRPNGTVTVKVTAHTPPAPQALPTPRMLRISVHDTGHGLSAELLSQLFVPFNRLGQESGPTKGTGIGLVVTRRLTELMGGSIGVSSVVGEGSVFWVDLRAVSQDEPLSDPAAALTGQSLRPAEMDTVVCTVLVVEDNAANLELVAQILADHPNIRLLQAPTGREGVAMARSHRPDVILMDIDLPDITGHEALHMLQRDARTQHIPVLAVSANAMAQDIVRGREAGFFRYLTKPFKIQEFLEALALALAASTPPGLSG
jgi:PAS domain S-box-containing protein